MEEKLMSIEEIKDEIRKEQERKDMTQESFEKKDEFVEETEFNNKKNEKGMVIQEPEKKSITDVNISDIKFALNTDRSYEEQTEDIVGAMATVKAVSDEVTAQDLADKKAEELKKKAEAKAKRAETASLEAETDKQKARRGLYEAVLNDFMITKHLPQWLMIIIVAILSPIYLAKTLAICVPLGFAKTLMDGVDNIFIRYSEVEEKNKPKVRVTIWIILGVLIVGLAAYIVLKSCKVI